MSPLVPVTEGRKTRVRLNVPDLVLVEGPYWLARSMGEIRRGEVELAGPRDVGDLSRGTVMFVPGSGWEMRPLQDNTGEADRTRAQDGIMKPVEEGGTLEVPAGLLWRQGYRKETELTNAYAGGASGVASSGDGYLKKSVDTTSWSDAKYQLGADMAAYPGRPSESAAPMDRVVRDTANAPANPHRSDWHFRFTVAGTTFKAADVLHRFYFCGPASRTLSISADGVRRGWYGKGEWLAEFCGGGILWLLEKRYPKDAVGPALWMSVHQSRWCENRRVVGTHHIRILSRAWRALRDGFCGSITLFCEGTEGGVVGSVLSYPYAEPSSPMVVRHYVPYVDDSPSTVPTEYVPVRIDVRRDQTPSLQLSKSVYPDVAILADDPFSLEDFPLSGGEIRVAAVVDLPPGTSADIRLYNSRGEAVPPSGAAVSGPESIVRAFAISGANLQERTYQAEVWLYSDAAHLLTPSLRTLVYTRDIATEWVAPGETVLSGRLTGVSVTPATTDPTERTAAFAWDDIANQKAILRSQGTFPCIIETEYDGVDWSNQANALRRAVLFRGYTGPADAVKRGRKTPVARGSTTLAAWPSQDFHEMRVPALGMWQRCAENPAPFTVQFSADPSELGTGGNPLPWRVLKAIRYCLYWAGFPPSMVGWLDTDHDARLLLVPGEREPTINAGSSLMDFAVWAAKMYLGATLDFDENAADPGEADPANWHGQWRIIWPKRGPYPRRPLCAFWSDMPPGVGSGLKMGAPLRAWETPDTYSPTLPGGILPGVPIEAGSDMKRAEPPQANFITVAGTPDGAVNHAPDQFTATWINFRSYNPMPLTPTAIPGHIDYIGRRVPRRYVQAGAIANYEAAAWTVRAIAETAGFGVREWTFSGPLVLVWDPEDAHQKRPRVLRRYDEVLVNGVPWLVLSCTSSYKRDGAQWAVYHLQMPRV